MSEEQRLSDARNFIANCDAAPLGFFPGERWGALVHAAEFRAGEK
ncbi:hypothetical protein JSE7799_03671 [Jannaschia seosinensis]|uniref:Uncharacterized protein n=1 Tax=Jannaschia seosinensis TaxID=313367 RepID=A0A0M7BDY1_9RHOB|nr:hypothetical protein [Jannaschia seosinensis]CUH40205.1 hypothetical protein JSE7799_02935 [Jannaschia seosinensis]CUH40930.1 hypothetical protein JSE7799_03671 [Jannaschia seosinensis]